MTTNYFKIKKIFVFFDDNDEASLKDAWARALIVNTGYSSDRIGVWSPPVQAGPWYRATPVGEMPSSAHREAA